MNGLKCVEDVGVYISWKNIEHKQGIHKCFGVGLSMFERT